MGDLYPSLCSSSLKVFYSPKNNPICRKCDTEEETSVHILCECEALDMGDIRKQSMGLELC